MPRSFRFILFLLAEILTIVVSIQIIKLFSDWDGALSGLRNSLATIIFWTIYIAGCVLVYNYTKRFVDPTSDNGNIEVRKD